MPKILQKTYRKARDMVDVSIYMASSSTSSTCNNSDVKKNTEIPHRSLIEDDGSDHMQLLITNQCVYQESVIDVNTSTSSLFNSDYSSDSATSEDESRHFDNDADDHDSTKVEMGNKPIDLNSQISEWVFKHNITLSALSDILKIFKNGGDYNNLPSDGRTLLKTPRCVLKELVNPGEYYHFGLLNCIERLLAKYKLSHSLKLVEIYVNVDGLPISKSSSSQLYPILCSLVQNPQHVETIGLYHGNAKPDTANCYLRKFVNEVVYLTNNGFINNGHFYNFKIKALIFDVPAKSFCTGTVGHTGYSSCSKCNIRGIYHNNRVCFPPERDIQLRTHHDFISKSDPEHHANTSILEEIPDFDMIQDIPLDYMHLICLGVMRKLLILWTGAAKPPSKMSSRDTKTLSAALVNNSSNVPCEFVRKSRSLEELKRWKATEFRQFLLYTGPVLLKDIVSRDMYLNFLCLHVAVTILSTKRYIAVDLDYARSLLVYFVQTYVTLYGKQHVSHNVHNLLHIVDDVARFGPLHNFSAFPFENYMQKIKKHLHKQDKPLSQIVKRMTELNSATSDTLPQEKPKKVAYNEHNDGPLLPGTSCPQYKKLLCENYVLKLKEGDNYCALLDGTVVQIKNFVTGIDGGLVLIGKKYRNLENLYHRPCNSSEYGIYLGSNLSNLKMWNVKEIAFKYFPVYTSVNQVEHQVGLIPIIHCNEF
ncbi:hypothetical protein PPYR_14636 [Photinus pyralis]|uniref:DUF4806 domain-containing protein n=1 Tax=Photinus pyralis TaxID=7054 RepID=A0A5N4A5T9_PHOPY|nr:uncharacterized protein LOC116181435 [Photinus pyralis]KAB0792677.1 hypothetical protein PPYR_14636 [Photinus pyralis]